MQYLRRVQGVAAERSAVESAAWKSWRSQYPALAEYLETETWDDGKARQTSTLLLFCEAGSVKGCLNDRETDRALWVTAGTIQGVIEALEKALAAGTGEWRSRPLQFHRGNGKKGKN
jgi:hypothetical protein